MLTLRNSITALTDYKGKSKFLFWNDIKKGDIFNFMLNIQKIRRNDGSLHATQIIVDKYDKDGMYINKAIVTINELVRYLNNFEFEEVKN